MNNDAIFSVRLAEVATVSAGYPLRGSAEALDEGGASFVQLKNVDPDFGIDWVSVANVELPSNKAPKYLASNDLIFSARGSRNFAYAMTEAPSSAVCSPHFFVLSVKDTCQAQPDFLAWQLNQKPAQDYFRRTAVGTQAVTTIRRPSLEDVPIVLPPLKEQKLIVEFWRATQKEQAALKQLIKNRIHQSDAIAYGLQTRAKEAR